MFSSLFRPTETASLAVTRKVEGLQCLFMLRGAIASWTNKGELRRIQHELGHLFNLSLQQEKMQTLLKTSTSCLVLVPKKASPSGLNDFREVALMSHVTKVNLTPFLQMKYPLDHLQFASSLSCRWMMLLSTCCSVFTLTWVILPLTPSVHLECASPCHVQCEKDDPNAGLARLWSICARCLS